MKQWFPFHLYINNLKNQYSSGFRLECDHYCVAVLRIHFRFKDNSLSFQVEQECPFQKVSVFLFFIITSILLSISVKNNGPEQPYKYKLSVGTTTAK